MQYEYNCCLHRTSNSVVIFSSRVVLRMESYYGVQCALLTDDAFHGCLTRAKDGLYFWTAGQRRNSKFVWKMNQAISYPLTYTNWHPGQPDNLDGNENCLHLFYSELLWNDIPCTLKMCFICEL